MLYLKPLQTGFPDDWDGRLVAAAASGGARLLLGPHAAQLLDAAPAPTRGERKAPRVAAPVVALTLFAWKEAVGPHRAAEMEGS